MEVIRRAVDSTSAFSSAVIEWRSSATAPYLMMVNTAFWWSAFYLNETMQLRLLVSLAACVFGWDILLSSSHEHSILMHLICWPIHNTLRTASVAMALYSARSLQQAELETACWMAYGTVGLLMINPVWQHQRIPQRIGSCAYRVCCAAKDVTCRYVVRPLLVCCHAASYVVLLKWVPGLCSLIANFFHGIASAIYTAWCSIVSFFVGIWTSSLDFIVSSWHRFIDYLCNLRMRFVNFLCDTWTGFKNGILAAVNAVKLAILCSICAVRDCTVSALQAVKNFVVAVARSIKNGAIAFVVGVKNRIIAVIRTIKEYTMAMLRGIRDCTVSLLRGVRDCTVSLLLAIKNGTISVLCAIKNGTLAMLRSLKNWVLSMMDATKNFIVRIANAVGLWVRSHVIEPIQRAGRSVAGFLRYWLCAHWWPALKEWLRRRVGVPLQRAFNYFCYGLVYVFCGYWMDPVGRFLRRQFHRALTFTKRQLALLGAFLHRTVLTPVAKWAKARFNEFVAFLKRMLRKFVISVRDSVFWPVCLLLADLLNQLYAYFHATVLQPIFDYFYEKYKMGEDFVFINFLGPACKIIIENIPEKSPFCDDSDTELVGLLPSEIEDEGAEHSDTEGGTSDRASQSSRPLSPLTDDERDFVRGLKFPTIDASESSDGEFNLASGQAPRKRRVHNTKSVPKDPMPSASNSADSSSQRSGGGGGAARRQRSRSSLSATSSNLSDSGVSQSSSSSKYLPTNVKELAVETSDVEKTPSKNESTDEEKRRRRSSMTSGTEMFSGSEVLYEASSSRHQLFPRAKSKSPSPEGLSSDSVRTPQATEPVSSRSRTASSSTPQGIVAADAPVDVDDQFEILDVKR